LNEQILVGILQRRVYCQFKTDLRIFF